MLFRSGAVFVSRLIVSSVVVVMAYFPVIILVVCVSFVSCGMAPLFSGTVSVSRLIVSSVIVGMAYFPVIISVVCVLVRGLVGFLGIYVEALPLVCGLNQASGHSIVMHNRSSSMTR